MNDFLYLLFAIVMASSLIVVKSYRAIFISSFSSIMGDAFSTLVNQHCNLKSGRLVYIPTATYAFDPTSPRKKGDQRRRARYDAKQKMALIANSLGTTDTALLELDSTTLTADSLKASLSNAQIIYVDGGNTFYLQKYIYTTKFWHIVKPHLESGTLYIGSSAGAIVAGKTIATAYWKGWDDPQVAEGMVWDGDTLSGASLGDYSVFPHYDSEAHDDLINSRKVDLDHDVLSLANDEVAVQMPCSVQGSRVNKMKILHI